MIISRLSLSASLSKWEFALICDFYWRHSHLCNLINYPADIQMNLGYDIQIVPAHIRAALHKTPIPHHSFTHVRTRVHARMHARTHTHTHTHTHLEGKVGEEPISMEEELSKEGGTIREHARQKKCIFMTHTHHTVHNS